MRSDCKNEHSGRNPLRIILMLCLSLPTLLFAYRPFITDDAGTVAPVTFELETAADYWRDAASFGLYFKHGITERMDIGIAFGRCVLPHDEKGYDPAELLLKFSLLPDRLAASFGGSFGNNCYSALLIHSLPISIFTIHANLGLSAGSDPAEGLLTCGLAGVAQFKRFSLGAELGGTHVSLNWWQTGLRFAVTERLAIDAALGGDFAHEISFNATTGLFFAFPHSIKGA